MARPASPLSSAPFTVALLGGESSGKSTLAQALHGALQAQGLHSALVPEHLRRWCEAAGRAPLAHEQAAIAAEQTRLIRQAQAGLVIADTTALVVAAYSELYFTDVLWPDVDAVVLNEACADYARRERRFGLTSAQIAAGDGPPLETTA